MTAVIYADAAPLRAPRHADIADLRAQWAAEDRARNAANDLALAPLAGKQVTIQLMSPSTWHSGWLLKLDAMRFTAADLDHIFSTLEFGHLQPIADAMFDVALRTGPARFWGTPLDPTMFRSPEIDALWAAFDAYLVEIGAGTSGRPTELIRREVPSYHGFRITDGQFDLAWGT